MNYIHKCKFDNREQFLELQGIIQDEDTEFSEPRPNPLSSAITIVEIGIITKPATFDEDGNELTAAYEVEGYHVDVLASEVIPELLPYCLAEIPSSPVHGNGWAMNEYEIVLNRAA